MKKIRLLGALVCAVLFIKTPTFALSCMSPLPTFDTMYADANIAFRGVVTDIDFVYDDKDEDYCNDMDADTSQLGTHTFTFAVEEELKGNVNSTISLTRTIDGIHCTRGGSCVDLELGEEYVVLTEDGETIASGLCGPCPYKLASEFTPPAPKEDCICTMQYDPVCGVDGNTYGNACALGCAEVELAYNGECEVQPEIDATCTMRYDGCNTCSVTNGKIGVCTEMACFTLNRQKCVEHDFVILTSRHEIIIRAVLDRYLSSFETGPARVEATDKLLAKIAKRKAEIQYTLAVSLFPVGSPALRSLQLSLEVLAALDSML